MKTVICQRWEESERGWGVRPDGYSLHLTSKDAETYVKKYWDSMPKGIPDEYSRPSSGTYAVTVSDEVYDKVAASECGIREFGSNYPDKL